MIIVTKPREGEETGCKLAGAGWQGAVRILHGFASRTSPPPAQQAQDSCHHF